LAAAWRRRVFWFDCNLVTDSSPIPSLPPRVSLLGFPIDCVTQKQTLDTIAASIRAGQGGWVLTPNLDILRRVTSEPETRALVDATTLRTADGMPLIWASRLKGTPLPERVTGSDLIFSLTQRAAQDGFGVYLLGGDPGVGDQAAAKLRELFPQLIIAGVESPPFGFEKDDAYMAAMRARVVAAKPDIVYVAVGFPKQERVIAHLRPAMPKAWFLGIGISFSFVTGHVQRAPKLVQKLGLEWVHRMAQEPGRLAKRYLVHGIPFALKLLVLSALRR
jgi:N-acetylglucosaminyldiphosphoundecaprenol N-acetyl-beta-D-mannosaminyltransferase